jgi:hypothetical protein
MPIFVCLLVHIKKELARASDLASFFFVSSKEEEEKHYLYVVSSIVYSFLSDLMIIALSNIVLRRERKKSVNRLGYSEG